MRLDNYLVEKGYFITRNKAQQAIKNNRIKVNNLIINKSGYDINEKDIIEIEKVEYEFVSRGGYKLLKAIKEFNLDFNNKIVIDIGASTGGFSDCSIQFGAKKVYAIDVGSNQLDDTLKNNPKIISIENTNARDLNTDDYKDIDYIVMDLSFISITKLLDVLNNLLFNNNINLIVLIKPQFEVENKFINKNGLVKNKEIHYEVINKIINSFKSHEIYLQKLTYSPIRGEKSGNIEYLAMFNKNYNIDIDKINIKEIINNAYINFL